MWTDIRQEIERVRQDLGLTTEQFGPVGAEEWVRIDRKVDEAFREPVPSAKRRALPWTQLRPQLATAVLSYFKGDEAALPTLRPAWPEEEPVFFFAKEGLTNPKTWWYRSTGGVAWQLLEYLWQQGGPLAEWGIMDRKYHKALCVTHSDEIIFCGEPLVSRVRQLGQQAGVPIR